MQRAARGDRQGSCDAEAATVSSSSRCSDRHDREDPPSAAIPPPAVLAEHKSVEAPRVDGAESRSASSALRLPSTVDESLRGTVFLAASPRPSFWRV